MIALKAHSRGSAMWLSLRSMVAISGLIALSAVSVPERAVAQTGMRAFNSCDDVTAEQQAEQQRYVTNLQRFANSKARPGSPEHAAILRAGAMNVTWDGSCGARSLRSDGRPDDFSKLTWKVLPIDRSAGRASPFAQVLHEGSIGMRVIGGQNVPYEWMFPETVAIYAERGGKGDYCTGLILSNEAVLTAGHCVCDLGLDRPAEGLTDSTLAVRIGKSSGVGPSVGIEYTRTKLFDPDFCTKRARLRDLAIRGNDAAIVFLEAKLEKVNGVKFIQDALMAADANSRAAAAIKDGTFVAAPVRVAPPQLLHSQFGELVIVGYGINTSSKDRLGVKVAASVPIASYMCGWPIEQGLFGCTPGRETVLIDVLGRDTCGGDSGGPAFLYFAPGLYYLMAITSRGVSRAGDCGAGGIYTLMSPPIVDWVRRIAGL